uniref:Reverse transcriptase domain-containing protein n=1 Tax=Tanacetum cinerariifolium TaxID=118510 RepID=A0A699GSK9_TANCI|nr:hypothetical protein [Tanacetum cinerariifolium]
MEELLLEKKLPQALQTLYEKLNKYVQEKQEEKNISEEQAAKVSSQYWKPPIYYDDDDDDEEYSIQVSEFLKKPPIAITPVLSIIEPEDSLSMGDENLSTILEKESDKVIKSSVENLVPIPSESKDLTDYESECDMPVCDDSSSKNEGLDDIEFVGELAPINPIPSGIVKASFDSKEDIRLIEIFLNDDSSPHSPEELNSKIPDAIIESFSPSPIPVEDSDSLMEEIDIFLASDDSIPPDDDVYFDIEPDTGILTVKVVDDISDNSTRELYVHVPNVNTVILISKEEKSPHLLSHQSFKVFHLINDSKSSMMIYGFFISISILLDQIKDEHLDTISETKSNEFIKSSVENLVPNPSEFEDLSDSECDVPTCDDFTTFSNLLFDADDDFSSSNNESFFDEDISKEIYSNPLFDEEIVSMKIDPHHFNVESDLIESLLNHDTSIISSSSKIDSLLDVFAGELILFKSIPPGIDKTDCDPEEEIRLIKKLLYDNSSPRPPEEFISKNSNVEIKSFSPFPIPVEDSDSLMKEINLSFTLDDSMPSGIEEDDYDSKRDILILEELLSNDFLSLPENESFHFDIPSSSRPPVKPSDDDSEL